MQERHNSIANALELCLSCTNPSSNGIYLFRYHSRMPHWYKGSHVITSEVTLKDISKICHFFTTTKYKMDNMYFSSLQVCAEAIL